MEWGAGWHYEHAWCQEIARSSTRGRPRDDFWGTWSWGDSDWSEFLRLQSRLITLATAAMCGDKSERRQVRNMLVNWQLWVLMLENLNFQCQHEEAALTGQPWEACWGCKFHYWKDLDDGKGDIVWPRMHTMSMWLSWRVPMQNELKSQGEMKDMCEWSNDK